MSYLENLAVKLQQCDGEPNLIDLVWNTVISPSQHCIEDLKKVIGLAISKEYLIAQCLWCKLYYKFDIMTVFHVDLYNHDFAECKDCTRKNKQQVIKVKVIKKHWKTTFN